MIRESAKTTLERRQVQERVHHILAFLESGNPAEMVKFAFDPSNYGTNIMLIDLFGAMTRNKVGWGHTDGYYRRNSRRQGAQASAHSVALWAHENPGWAKLTRKFAREWMDLVKDKLTDIGG